MGRQDVKSQRDIKKVGKKYIQGPFRAINRRLLLQAAVLIKSEAR